MKVGMARESILPPFCRSLPCTFYYSQWWRLNNWGTGALHFWAPLRLVDRRLWPLGLPFNSLLPICHKRREKERERDEDEDRERAEKATPKFLPERDKDKEEGDRGRDERRGELAPLTRPRAQSWKKAFSPSFPPPIFQREEFPLWPLLETNIYNTTWKNVWISLIWFGLIWSDFAGWQFF